MDDTEKEAGVHSTFESRLQRSFFRNRGRHQNTPVGNSPGQSSIFRFVRIGSVSLNLVVFAILTFPPSGSWEGDIRLWKLDSKLKSFSLVGTMPALGVVNSLQFVSPPKSFFDAAAWTKEGNDGATKRRDVGRYLLIAGMGREHKFGRWQNVIEGWNRALVVALSPRTLS